MDWSSLKTSKFSFPFPPLLPTIPFIPTTHEVLERQLVDGIREGVEERHWNAVSREVF